MALEKLGQRVDSAGWYMELVRTNSGDLILQVRNPKIKQHGKAKIIVQTDFDPAKPDRAAKIVQQALLIDT